MTDPYDPDLDAVDRAARAASQGLHDHVNRRVDPEPALAALPPVEPPRRYGRFLAAAAVAVLFVGSVAVLGDGPSGDDRSRLEMDEDGNPLPPPEPGMLTPLGPNDGRDSIQLPLAVEPSVDLKDGQAVTASSPGFVPGEQVGIVQCAREAGGEVREQRAGIDGCNVGSVEYATADDEGVATGTFHVHRILTTPATGTVDCALEAERCIVAMGAISNYDRSGGLAVTFAGGGEPIDIPTITVSPADGLADGDVVHVEGEGFTPGPIFLNVCSIDPAGCWATGEWIDLSDEDVQELGLANEYGGGYGFPGLLADADGRVSGDVPVWQFLPGPTPGSYIDCAVSDCSLRITAEIDYSPPPVALGFAPGGQAPQPPAVAVSPTDDLEPGDEVVVRGAGFEPGARFSISLCVSSADDPTNMIGCASSGEGSDQIDGDGGFAELFDVPDPKSFGEQAVELVCDGVQVICTIQVDSYPDDATAGAPQFAPEPVEVTFRQ